MLYEIEVDTPRGDALIDITGQVKALVAGSGVQAGLCVLFVPHTTAAITPR